MNKEKEKLKKKKVIRPKRWKFPKLPERDIEILRKQLEDYRKNNRNYGVPPNRTYEDWPYPTGGS